ncbi:MAG: hypothetical protein IT445_13230 [Phycisphaeraceae bacterium]|nr:hypothetical protein [Phycisphaeraceae bacterium]
MITPPAPQSGAFPFSGWYLHAVPSDISDASHAVLREVEARGYRIGIGYDQTRGRWIAAAKHDRDGQVHRVSAESESALVAALAESVGINLPDG